MDLQALAQAQQRQNRRQDMKQIWFFILIILIVLIGLLTYFFLTPDRACFNNHCFIVELAKTPKEREQGLMFRDKLETNRGMLFIYPQEGKYDFWMKNTLIPLDIIWIDKDQKVVSIAKDAQPCLEDDCSAISPFSNAQYVLEINGGLADKLGITIGQKANIKLHFFN